MALNIRSIIDRIRPGGAKGMAAGLRGGTDAMTPAQAEERERTAMALTAQSGELRIQDPITRRLGIVRIRRDPTRTPPALRLQAERPERITHADGRRRPITVGPVRPVAPGTEADQLELALLEIGIHLRATIYLDAGREHLRQPDAQRGWAA